jgi:heavy metal translocating P-type ATPase
MVRKIGRFFGQYKAFSLAIITGIIGLSLEFLGYHTLARLLVSAIAIVSCLPLLRDMWHDLRSGTYGIDILAVTAILTSVVLGEYWAGIVVVIMLTGGEALEDYAEHRSKSELSALLNRAPQRATILRGRKAVQVPVHEVQVGDKIVLKPGEVVPVDAIILEGSSNFDESALTGESLPASKQPGEQILSGAINVDGAITARCAHSAKDSQYEQIIKLVRAAGHSQAPFVRLADRYAIPFTIVAFTIAGCAWIATGSALRFLEVIVVATPCPLILAAPIAIISGMSRSAKNGIIIKTGGALERLAQAKTIAFDKTGTLTLGQLQVNTIQSFGNVAEHDILAAAASLEQHSNHVVAQAILNRAKEDKIKLSKIKSLKETAGQGLKGSYSGKSVLVGRLSYLQTESVKVAKSTNLGKLPATTATYVAINGHLAGVITFTDTVRQESAETITALNKLGYQHLHMVTGDNEANAQAVANQVGISLENITTDALPADKLHALENIKDRPVVFVGDGVNDAPVLTASEVGIALGARGSTAASESADIVIMLDDVSKVATVAEISKRTFQIAWQSIVIGIIISIGLMGVYATGRFSPLSGAVLQEVVDIIVIFNALRAHGPFSKPSIKGKSATAKAVA